MGFIGFWYFLENPLFPSCSLPVFSLVGIPYVPPFVCSSPPTDGTSVARRLPEYTLHDIPPTAVCVDNSRDAALPMMSRDGQSWRVTPSWSMGGVATRAGAGGLLSPREWPGVPLEVEEKGEYHCLVSVGCHGIVYCASVGTLQVRI